MNLQQRMIYLQSWWVASEFMRRHPELELIETHPGDDQYDCLTILDANRPEEMHIRLNRLGRIHAYSNSAPSFDWSRFDIDYPIEWTGEVKLNDRRLLPRLLELAVGLSSPSQTPVTTSKTLTFRVIYQLLLFAVNDSQVWEVRNSAVNSWSSSGDSAFDFFADIASARNSLVHYAQESKQKEAFWAVLCDNRCIGLLQESSTLHRPNADPVNLMKIYNANKREILPTAMEIRGLLTS